jgi:hypothetical protein
MSVREIVPTFPYINVIIAQDAASVVYLFFQRVDANDLKYLAIHTQNADGTPSKTALLENHDMYEPRGLMFHPDGSAVVYGANRNRSKVLKIDVPGWTPGVSTKAFQELQAAIAALQVRIVLLEAKR